MEESTNQCVHSQPGARRPGFTKKSRLNESWFESRCSCCSPLTAKEKKNEEVGGTTQEQEDEQENRGEGGGGGL